MHRHESRRHFLTSISSGIALAQRASRAAPVQQSPATTLFAFDDTAIPFRENVFLTMCAAEKHPANPVVRYGSPGDPDEFAAKFYGSIIHHDGRFKMWYPAADREVTRYAEWQKLRGSKSHSRGFYGWRLAYAESEDGIHWIKPSLGLVEYNGSRKNNLLKIDPPDLMGMHLIVLHEPEESNPEARFKMLVSTAWTKGQTSVPLISPDGFTWRAPRKLKLAEYQIPPEEFFFPREHFEQSGLYRWQGLYHVTGQQISPWIWLPDGQPCGRVMTVLHSRDFEQWPAAKTLAFVRDGYRSAPEGQGEEVHIPAAIWNRGNVLLGIYGQWHGAKRAQDRSVDLGFLLSNDGLHFREPVPDFHFLRPGPKGSWDSRALLQGQGFEHVGERTYIWYGSSNLFAQTDEEARNQIGLATIRRDGFGYLAAKNPGGAASVVSYPIRIRPTSRISLNVEGLSSDARIRIQLLDSAGRPLPSYTANLTQSGVQQELAWPARLPDRMVRIAVTFEGNEKAVIRLYSIYVN